MKRVTVHMIRGRSEPAQVDPYNDTEEPGEGPQARPLTTIETRIYVDSVRCYYAAPQRESGSRITFRDGGGFVVTESPAELDALFDGSVSD